MLKQRFAVSPSRRAHMQNLLAAIRQEMEKNPEGRSEYSGTSSLQVLVGGEGSCRAHGLSPLIVIQQNWTIGRRSARARRRAPRANASTRSSTRGLAAGKRASELVASFPRPPPRIAKSIPHTCGWTASEPFYKLKETPSSAVVCRWSLSFIITCAGRSPTTALYPRAPSGGREMRAWRGL
jgi:hypothetical protein